jgi:hypothetical protein
MHHLLLLSIKGTVTQMSTPALDSQWIDPLGLSPVSISYSFAELRVESLLRSEYRDYPSIYAGLTTVQQQLVNTAVTAWETAGAIDLQHQADAVSVDLRIGLAAIDGSGGILGEATYWSHNGTMEKAVITFDISDLTNALYTTDPPSGRQVSFYQLALHELGHALGVGHDSNPKDVMYPYANSAVSLSENNKATIVSLYGPPTGLLAPPIGPILDGVDAGFYRSSYLDIALAGANPLEHYHSFGWKEGRDPNTLFDTSWYLEKYPDVASAQTDPLVHYRTFGWKEDRDPSQQFSTDSYLTHNPDVALAGVNPMDHYLLYGAAEGRII